MTHARVAAGAVLDAAQKVIDEHSTSLECFGRCVKCGEAWPCPTRSQAAMSFYRTGRLPRRRPGCVVNADAVLWSPVDWFGSGRISTAGRGGQVRPPWRLRRTRA